MTPSQLERGGTVSPSPARNALQGHLEGGLTLNRKKSWFGSARDILSKALRGDGSSKTHESEDRTTSIQYEEAEVGQSDESSITPLRPRPERQRTFTPRNAISSLRQHISSSNRHKRPALAEFVNKDVQTPVGPERIIMTPAPDDEVEAEANTSKLHARKNSLGKSLVGSIRSFGRNTMSRTTSPSKSNKDDQFSPSKHAAGVPLPSSPINIPAPPTLHVDLGPSALMSNSPQDQESELMRMTNPAPVVGERPVPTYYTRLPGEGPNDQSSSIAKRQSLTPSDLLHLPTDNFGFSIAEEPVTPGQKSPFQIDGANDETELFERSVEYKDKAKKKENRGLKKMVSLDAMAEECAISSPPGRLGNGDPRRCRDQMSQTTIKSCPDDMPEITRQLAHLQTLSAGHRDPVTGQWKSEDPFAPRNSIGDIAASGPPSPKQSVKLPFRPKITVQSAEAIEPKTFDDRDLATPEVLKEDGIECMENIGRDSVVSETETASADHFASANKNSTVADTSKAEMVLTAMGGGSKSRESLPNAADSGEYGEFKTKQLFGDLSEPELPEYVDADATEEVDFNLSLQRTPFVAQLYHRISNSKRSSPPRCGAGTTHPADVSDVFWKCNFQDRPELSKDERDIKRALRDPSRHSCASSVESLAESDASPQSIALNSTPNMGDRIEFDLQRSARNMRYNALSDIEGTPDHEDAARLPESIRPAALRPNLKIDTTSEFKARNSSDLSLARFDGGRTSSRQVSPLKLSTRQSRVGMSSDSIDPELQRAISQHYVFQAAVAGLGITEPYSSSTATATPSGSHPVLDPESQRSRKHNTPAITPENSGIWQEIEHGPFDTPQQSEQGDLNEHEFKTPFGDFVAIDDSLDDCLEMIHNYNKSQEMLSSDTVQPAPKVDNPFTSSPMKEVRGSSASPVSPKKPPPARYRNSLKGRK